MFTKIVRRFSTKFDGFFITTPIYYANASPHLGHLYSSVIADSINRFQKLNAGLTHNIFSTGTDEHGIKVLQAATKNNENVSTYCDNISNKYKSLFQLCNVEFTDFIRTTEDRHKKAVWKMWNVLKANDSIYKDTYSGWYCVSDETFLTESQLKIGPNDEKISLESGHPVEWTEEENYMFRLSQYQDDVLHWAKQENRVTPKKFNKILLDLLHEELPNISVSRPKARMPWGIPVPGDDAQNIYVWLDALANYLTVSGYPEQYSLWPPNMQIIGKDILKFHGIYWPAFLIAAGIEPPQQLLVHSHWTVDGQKMSKSKQNVIDPIERAQTYTMEGIRYFLLREGVQHSDGNYSDTKIIRILNAELADTFGNLLSRACAKSLNPKQIFPKIHSDELGELIKLDSCKVLLERQTEVSEKCYQNYTSFSFHHVADNVIALLHAANNFFESSKPWELKNGNEHATRKLETIISITMESLRISGIIMQPMIPEFTSKLLDRLNIPAEKRMWKESKLNLPNFDRNLVNLDSSILFKRIILEKDSEKSENKKRQ